MKRIKITLAIIGIIILTLSMIAYGYNVLNYTEQGGARTVIGGSLDVVSGGDLDIESGGSLKLAGTAITSTAAELNIMDGFTGAYTDLNYAASLNATGVTTSEFDILDGATLTVAELNQLDGIRDEFAAAKIALVVTADNTEYASTTTVTDGTSVTVGAGVLAAGQSLRFTCAGTITGANAAKSLILYIDNAAIVTLTTDAADTGDYWVEFIMALHTDLANQNVIGKLVMAGGVENEMDLATDTTDFAAEVVVKTQVQAGNASDNITQKYCLVEYLP